MKRMWYTLSVVLAGLTAVWVTPEPATARQDQAPPDGVEVLTRGPVHEAYAEPTDPTPRATPVVSQQPPESIQELPPDTRPEGENVQWIPGYWFWDDDSRGFLWVSGFWRDVPPGRRWVSGYWQQVQDGWQWVPGFWAAETVTEVEYLPQPPDAVPEAQPPAPDQTSVYVPGVWVWRDTNYYWRPGFYVGYQPGWTYIPAHYTYTPYGYIFVDGYWDHPLHQRGVLFAPVRLARDVLVANYTYVPRYVLYPDALLTSLFVRPAAYSYYFGDYFDNRYTSLGYVPWVDYRVARTAHDPNFTYYQHTYRSDPNWIRGMQELYVARREGTFPRPPRTFADQVRVAQNVNVQNTTVLRNLNLNNVSSLVQMASPVNQVRDLRADVFGTTAARPGSGTAAASHSIRLQQVSQEQQAQIRAAAHQAREVQQRRQQAEARLGTADRAGEGRTQQARRANLDLPRVTTSARPIDGRTQQTPAGRQPPPPPQTPQAQERHAPSGRERPNTPERPITPERPMAPERPTTPGRPDRPMTPPERPERPTTPPVRPDRPGTPPARPDRPTTPPERPTTPPMAPERPTTPPQRPTPPERPIAPPGRPDRPTTPPERPNAPERPTIPDRPTTPPERPTTPGRPDRPTTPPERPTIPARPERPARPPERPTAPERPAVPQPPPGSNRPETPQRPVPPERPAAPPQRPTNPPNAPPERPAPPQRPTTPPERPMTPQRPAPPERPDRPETPRPPAPGLAPHAPQTPGHPERPGSPPNRPDHRDRPDHPRPPA